MNRDLPYIIIVDSDDSINRSLSMLFRDYFYVATTTSVREGIEITKRNHPFLAVVELKMSGAGGLEVLRELKKIDSAIKVIIMSAYGKVSDSVEVFKEGAIDFLIKPFDSLKLLENVRRLAASLDYEKELSQPQIKGIVGESPAIKHTWDLVKRFAPSDVRVLLHGETGTGKELFARVIHGMSSRKKGPFVPVDCSALPAPLFESEMFGYEKGAFTGAISRKEGLFESANMGTLFLDEIENIPLSAQAKLLRVIQEHKVIHLGSRRYCPIPLNIRIIAATNIDLEEESHKGNFRSDLYYRISEATVKLPPLRERHGDIRRLINYFLAQCSREEHKSVGITDETMGLLEKYHWPGNIRELENVIKSSFLLSDDYINPCHLPDKIAASTAINTHLLTPEHPAPDGLQKYPAYYESVDIKIIRKTVTEDSERQAIIQVMKDHPFINKTHLATLLKVDPKTLRSKLRKYGFAQ
ncbi:MAG: sigma-54-dependent Fis family transcriptional regulator [Nitrospirae bacterium]|nr:sigma-54-dependent Fis family transcriptional regulator [Nitrospirota bacterium]